MWRPPTACPVLFMKVLVKVWFTTGLPCASPKVRTNTSPNPTNTEVVFGFFINLFFLCLFLFVLRPFAPVWLIVHRFLQPSRGEVTKYVEQSGTRGRKVAPQASRLKR